MKKILKILITFLLIILIYILIFNFKSLNFNNLSDLNKKALEEYNTAMSSNLWEGYSLDHPMILIEKGDFFNNKKHSINLYRKNIFLVNVDIKSPLAKKIKMPKDFKLQKVYKLNRLHPLAIKTISPIGNFSSIDENLKYKNYNNIYKFKYGKNNFNSAKKSQELIPFLSHEFFHYNMQKTWSIKNEYLDIINNKDYISLIGLEYKILDNIMNNLNNKVLLENYLKEYIVVSREKENINKEYFNTEKDYETIEGSATYIGMKYGNFVNTPLPFLEGARRDEDRSFYYIFTVVANYDNYINELRYSRYDSGSLLLFALNNLDYNFYNNLENSTIYKEVEKYNKDDLNSLDLNSIKEKYDFKSIEIESSKIFNKLN